MSFYKHYLEDAVEEPETNDVDALLPVDPDTDEGIDATIGGRLWITGGTAVKQGNSYWHGQTTDVTIDGVTLHFKDGLLI